MQLFNFTINNKLYQLKFDYYTIIQICELYKISIPRFCYHEELSIAGNCRMCLVEIKNSLKPITACSYPMSNNIIINTNSNTIKSARESIIELLLINHPLDCPICDQGGECDLQDQTLVFGKDRTRFIEQKRSVVNKNFGPFIKTIMTRCIHCTRCIRYFNEIVGLELLGTVGRGVNTEIETYIYKTIESEIIGNVVDLCPVGALTSKPYSYNARPWELVSFESIDLLDSFCSFIRLDFRSNNLLRIIPAIKKIHNGYWITDKIRYSYDAFKKNRLLTPLIKISNTYYEHVSWQKVYQFFIINYLFCKKKKWSKHIYIFTGNFLDIKTLLYVKLLSNIFQIQNLNIHLAIEFDFRNQFLINTDFINVENSNVFVLFGLNTKIENAIFNIKLKKISTQSDINNFFYIGNNIDSNLKIKHISLNVLKLIYIYYGKHFICNYIINGSNTHFINGNNDFADEQSNIQLTLNLTKNLKKNILFHYNNLYSSLITCFEYNIYPNIESLFWDIPIYWPKFCYLLNYNIDLVENKNIIANKNCFLVYQGHNFDPILSISNIIMPTTTYIEKNGHYINFEGNLLYATTSLSNNTYCLNDDIIIYTILKYFNTLQKKNNYLNINSLIKQTNIILFKKKITIKLFGKNTLLLSNELYTKYKCKKYFLFDLFFINLNRNFYNMDIMCKNSQQINDYLKYIKKNKINF